MALGIAYNNAGGVSFHSRGALPVILGRADTGTLKASTLSRKYSAVTYTVNVPSGSTYVFPVLEYREGVTYGLLKQTNRGHPTTSDAAYNAAVEVYEFELYVGNNVILQSMPFVWEGQFTDVKLYVYGLLPADQGTGVGLYMNSVTPYIASRFAGAVYGQPVISMFPHETLTPANQAVAGVIPQSCGFAQTDFAGFVRSALLLSRAVNGNMDYVWRQVYAQEIVGNEVPPAVVVQLPYNRYIDFTGPVPGTGLYDPRFVNLSAPLQYGPPVTQKDSYGGRLRYL